MTPVMRAITNNLKWKLGSLATATLLWYAVVGVPEQVTVQAVSVYYQNLPTGLVLTSDLPDVQLELRGSSGALNRENLSGVKILLDLSRVTSPGEQSFTITAPDVVLPDGVGFLSAVPSRLFLEFDRRASKDVPVLIELTGAPAEGYQVTRQEADPPRVRVSGPEQRVRSLDSAATDPLDIAGRHESVEAQRNAYVSDPQLQLESPSLVTVRVAIEKGNPSPLP
jgi:hypothetical protein